MTEDEMVGWHHQLNGHEFEQVQELVMNREAWHAAVEKSGDTTEQLNWSQYNYKQKNHNTEREREQTIFVWGEGIGSPARDQQITFKNTMKESTEKLLTRKENSKKKKKKSKEKYTCLNICKNHSHNILLLQIKNKNMQKQN